MKISPARFIPVLLIAGLLSVAECKAASPQSTAPLIGYEYLVRSGDTVEDIAQAYREQGVDVTAKQILAVNPRIKFRTVFYKGLRCQTAETGVKLFIPGQVKQKEETKLIAPRINEPIEFDGFTVSQISSQAEAKRLMTQKLKSSGTYYSVSQDANGKQIMTPHDGFDFFQYPDGKTIRTETIEQFIYACEHYRANSPDDKNKAYSATTCDIQAEMWMNNIKDKLELMAKAQPSIHSYLNGKYLKELPVDVLMSSLNACDGETSDKYDKILKTDVKTGKTMMDYTKRWAPLHIVNLVWENDTTFRFTDATMEIDYYIKEIARGDFDGDGNEDAQILIGWHTQGTMGGSYTAMVTRAGPNQKLKWVESASDKCEKPETNNASCENYAQAVQLAYNNAWMPLEEPAAASNTKASITIASDGKVIESHILSPSGNAGVDRSVQHTLDKITFVAPFPESMKFSKRTFIINFGLKASQNHLASDITSQEVATKTNRLLQCSPNIVKLMGTIKNLTFPGLPNYKDITKGDAPEDYWILKLDASIDVAKDPEYPAPDENKPQLNQHDLQLNLDVYLKGDYKAYQQFLGKKVEVTGELTQGFTVHHKTPVMIRVRDIKLVE